MSTLNSQKISLSAFGATKFLGVMLIAWQPFWSGARLPTLLLLLLGIWMLARKKIDLSSLAAKRLGIVFLLLGLPILLSIPTSFDISGSLSVAATLLIFYIVGLGLLAAMSSESSQIWLERALLILVLIWTVDGYIQFVFGKDLLQIPHWEGGRVIGPFRDNLHFGLFLALLLPIVLWRMVSTHPLRALPLYFLIGTLIVLSGARSNLLLLLLASLALWLQIPSRRHKLIAVIAIAMTLTIAISLTTEEMRTRLAQFFTIHDSTLSFAEKLNAISSSRMVIWENAWRMLEGRPIFGVGASAFQEAYYSYAPPDDYFVTTQPAYHAHQMYISIAAETGIIGLAGFLALIGLCIGWYYKAPPKNRANAAPFAAPLAMVAFPIQSQPVLYTIWWFPVLLLLACAMLAALSAPGSHTPPHNQLSR